MLKSEASRLHISLVSADVVLSALVFLALIARTELLRAAPLGTDETTGLLVLALVASLVWPASIALLGLYESQRRKSLWAIPFRMLTAAAISIVSIAATAFVVSVPVSPAFPLLCGMTQMVVLTTLRLMVLALLRRARRRGRNFRNVVIVGTGPRAAQIRRNLRRHPEWGLRILGFIDDGDVPVDPDLRGERIRKFVDFPNFLRDEVIDELIVACPRSMIAAIVPVVHVCATAGVPVLLLSDIFGDLLPAPRFSGDDPLPALRFAPVHHNAFALAIKRGIDLVGGSLLLIGAAPIIGAAVVLIRLTSPGPAFYRQIRCGLNRRPFEMLKLRTMVEDAEDRKIALLHLNEMAGPVFKMLDDPRVTPLGRVLRRWSVDELPQLWNVLRGDMSLVGPRPPVPSEVDCYSIAQRRRLSMRPGITCIWQVSGRNTIPFDEWTKLDVEYIDTWSLWGDFKLLVKTIPAVLFGKGAA